MSAAADPPARPAAGLLAARILVAEDGRVAQEVALGLLARLGYAADVAEDGAAALDALAARPYDLVLLDLQMPGLDGLETTRRIRARWPPPGGPRVVAMTAGAGEEERAACLAAGMDGFLGKPLREAELARLLAQLLAPAAAGRGPRGLAPASAPAADRPPVGALDREVLATIRRMGPPTGQDILTELIDMFVEDAPPMLAAIDAALGRGDATALARAAHGLKGSCANLGVRALGASLGELEALGMGGGDLAGAARLLARAEDELRDALELLRAERRAPG